LAPLDGTDPARLVHHARRAGDPAALLRYGVVAATGAAAQGAHREAVAHFRAVRPHAQRLPAAERAQVLEQYGLEAYLAGLSVEGLEARRAALIERERLGEPVRVGENHRWISRLEWWSGRGAEARDAAARAVEVLEGGEPTRELAMAYSNRSQLHMLAHELADAVEWGERARDLADRLGDLDTSMHASVNIGAAQVLGGDEGGASALRDTYVTASAAGLADHAARALVCLATFQEQSGHYDAAAVVFDEALGYAASCGLEGYVQYLLGVRAGQRLERCDWDGALADADDALGRPNRIGVAVVGALVARGRILAARGEPEALSILDRAADHAYGTEELQRIGPVAAARAEYYLLCGNPDRAADEARRGLTLALAKGHPWFASELAYRLWQATGRAEVGGAATAPHRLLMEGDWEGAATAWANLGRAYARVDALAKGDATAAAEALRILDRLGAVRAAGRVRADLRRRGVTGVPRGPRASTTSNAAGLTRRQMEVLRLLADGLTNTDIAAQLTLSHKTVEHHVAAVLDKLKVATRGQAIAAAHRMKLVS
jgi:DNA-binding CsgD family transcriptional regulator